MLDRKSYKIYSHDIFNFVSHLFNDNGTNALRAFISTKDGHIAFLPIANEIIKKVKK
jgi:hypothetical protein